jgi:transcription termination factor NusB
MVHMDDVLRQIIDELRGIEYSRLTKAERNILRLAARGLGKTVKVVGEDIVLEKAA